MSITVNGVWAAFPCKYAKREGWRGAVRRGIHLRHVFLIWNVGGWLTSCVPQPINFNCGSSYVPKTMRWKALAVNGFSCEDDLSSGKCLYTLDDSPLFLISSWNWKRPPWLWFSGLLLNSSPFWVNIGTTDFRRMTWLMAFWGNIIHACKSFVGNPEEETPFCRHAQMGR